jgi:hypothetical protein
MKHRKDILLEPEFVALKGAIILFLPSWSGAIGYLMAEG